MSKGNDVKGCVATAHFICVGCGSEYHSNSVYPNLLAGRAYCDECAYELDRTGYEVPLLDDKPHQMSLFAGCAAHLKQDVSANDRV